MPNRRTTYFMGFVLAALCLGISYGIELVERIAPCNLCLLQRFVMTVVLFLFLFAAIHHAKKIGNGIYAILILLFSALGSVIAMRQVILQNLPPELAPSSCGVDLKYLLQTFPFPQAVKIIFQGTAECAHVPWTLLGMSMAAWAFVFFVVFAATGLIQLFRGKIV